MSISTIRATVEQNLANAGLSSYARQAEPVIAALEAREFEAADRLTSAGVNLGARRDQVRALIEEVGLQFRPAPAAVSSNGGNSGDLAAQIDSIRDSLNQMQQALDSIVRASR